MISLVKTVDNSLADAFKLRMDRFTTKKKRFEICLAPLLGSFTSKYLNFMKLSTDPVPVRV